MSPFLFAFMLTFIAGLSTGIGGLLAFFTKKTNTKFLAFALGFSAGVMIYVSMVEIFPEAEESLIKAMGEPGRWLNLVAFFGGILLIGLIDRLIPNFENPHELKKVEDLRISDKGSIPIKEIDLKRVGIFTALAITIHNFPEGIATFIAAYQDPALGVAIAVAIAIHNIPEGIAVSVPIYYATGSRKKALIYSILSGLAEPVGAIAGYLILMPFLSDITLGLVFSSVAGIMVYISFDELLPSAQKFGKHHLSIFGLVLGMLVMGVSLLLLD